MIRNEKQILENKDEFIYYDWPKEGHNPLLIISTYNDIIREINDNSHIGIYSEGPDHYVLMVKKNVDCNIINKVFERFISTSPSDRIIVEEIIKNRDVIIKELKQTLSDYENNL